MNAFTVKIIQHAIFSLFQSQHADLLSLEQQTPATLGEPPLKA